jgi:hypothetical protein
MKAVQQDAGLQCSALLLRFFRDPPIPRQSPINSLRSRPVPWLIEYVPSWKVTASELQIRKRHPRRFIHNQPLVGLLRSFPYVSSPRSHYHSDIGVLYLIHVVLPQYPHGQKASSDLETLFNLHVFALKRFGRDKDKGEIGLDERTRIRRS